jgi:hypothetical protein
MRANDAVSEKSDPVGVPESLRALLANLIDYAGLFPPAGLGMSEAVANYASYLAGEYAWILGPFVLPANRLEEFTQAQSGSKLRAPWRLSCLVGVEADLSKVERFHGQSSAQIASIETKTETADQVTGFMARLPASVTVYFEVPLNCSVELLSTIRRMGARAKVRTGGLVPEAIPSSDALSGFLARCASTRTAFKATAGLHHPLRCLGPLTYETNAPSAKMHGFLNVFLAAGLAYQGVVAGELTAMFGIEDAACFTFENQMIRCPRGTLSTDQVRVAREQFAVSFGSCSFDEPIKDLQALQLL